jgi:hypothetical protein
VTPDHEQPRVASLGTARELGQQLGLAAAGLADDEHGAGTLALHPAEGIVEGGQFSVASDEGRRIARAWL